MNIIITTISAAAVIAVSAVSAQAGERSMSERRAAQQERSLDARDRMDVGLEREIELPGRFGQTPDSAYRVHESWSSNDNEG